MYDEDILYDTNGSMVKEIFEYSKDLILHLRKQREDDTIWELLEKMANRWEARNKNIEEKNRLARTKGSEDITEHLL